MFNRSYIIANNFIPKFSEIVSSADCCSVLVNDNIFNDSTVSTYVYIGSSNFDIICLRKLRISEALCFSAERSIAAATNLLSLEALLGLIIHNFVTYCLSLSNVTRYCINSPPLFHFKPLSFSKLAGIWIKIITLTRRLSLIYNV